MVWGASEGCAMAGCLKPVSEQEALMDAVANIDVAHTLTGARQGCPTGMQTRRCFEVCYMHNARGELVNCPSAECCEGVPGGLRQLASLFGWSQALQSKRRC